MPTIKARGLPSHLLSTTDPTAPRLRTFSQIRQNKEEIFGNLWNIDKVGAHVTLDDRRLSVAKQQIQIKAITRST